MDYFTFLKPTKKSFVTSLVYDIIPVLVVILGISIFKVGKILNQISLVIAILLSLYMFACTVSAHLSSIMLTNSSVRFRKLHQILELHFEDIKDVTFRERKTINGRKDRLIVFQLKDGYIFGYPSSILTINNERFLMVELRKKFAVKTQFDKASI